MKNLKSKGETNQVNERDLTVTTHDAQPNERQSNLEILLLDMFKKIDELQDDLDGQVNNALATHFERV